MGGENIQYPPRGAIPIFICLGQTECPISNEGDGKNFERSTSNIEWGEGLKVYPPRRARKSKAQGETLGSK